MTVSLPYILLLALAVFASLNFIALLRDLRTGTSRFAHESQDVTREQLPLNFWLGVASKAAGMTLALALGVVVFIRMM